MAVPQHLSHKPIIAVDNYDTMDGHYKHNTDAKALSIGKAQYQQGEISAKIFRNKNNRWSRQSEELPLHRVLDLAILIVTSMNPETNSQTTSLKEQVVSPEGLKELSDYYKEKEGDLKPRLEELKSLLNNLK